MEEANSTRYWCHMCSQTVDALIEEEIKCPLCRSGFVEEMEEDHHSSDQRAPTTSIWAPILMEMMNNSPARNQTVETTGNGRDLDSQLQEILRRRRGRRSVSVVQLLQGVRSTLEPDDDNNNNNNGGNGERGRVILMNPNNPIIVVPSSVVVGSLSEYFIGPGFEALLERLAENDPNRYGTPPARKQDVESLATVKIQEPSLQCSVCLEDFEVGVEAKQMPCKHSFHADCLLPWLELHSSCPVCRYQLPTDETTNDDSATTETGTNDSNGVGGDSHATSSSQETENSSGNRQEEGEEQEEENNDGGRIEFSIPWPFSSLFSSSSQDSNPSN